MMTQLMSHVLIVEDEPAISAVLKYNLEADGYSVSEARDGEEAITQINEQIPDLILLDLMLPLIPGIEVCRYIRRNPGTQNTPVIMITARGEEEDRIRGLNTGADDYIVKPFSPAEVLARMRAVLRRTNPGSNDETLTFGDIQMDLVSHRVVRNQRSVHLGPTEFRLLRFLMEAPGRVFSREKLLNAVWGSDIFVEPRTVDVHIRRLRKALICGDEIDVIRTVRSAGYALDDSEP